MPLKGVKIKKQKMSNNDKKKNVKSRLFSVLSRLLCGKLLQRPSTDSGESGTVIKL